MRAGLTTIAIVFAASCLGESAIAADSLYTRIGGYETVAAITDGFVGQLVTNPEFAPFFVGFSNDSKKRIRQDVVDFLCQATGGPCSYVGRDMKTAHAGIGITKKQWDDSIAILGATLVQLKIPDKEQQELAGLVAPLEKDIVDKP